MYLAPDTLRDSMRAGIKLPTVVPFALTSDTVATSQMRSSYSISKNTQTNLPTRVGSGLGISETVVSWQSYIVWDGYSRLIDTMVFQNRLILQESVRMEPDSVKSTFIKIKAHQFPIIFETLLFFA